MIGAVRHAVRRVREQRRPIRFLTSRVLVQTGLSRHLTITRPTYRLRFHPAALPAELWVDGNARLEDERFLASYLRPGDVVIDIGANVGSTALVAAHAAGPAGRVIAVEPHPRTFAYLRENLALNGAETVEAHNVALGAERRQIRFADQRSDTENRVTADGALIVPQVRLDELVEAPSIALIKLDVEGYEHEVLLGGAAVLACARAVYFEADQERSSTYGSSTSDVLALLRANGLQPFHVRERSLLPVAAEFVATSTENLLAVRDPEEARARLSSSGSV